jgi:hypothetical protein
MVLKPILRRPDNAASLLGWKCSVGVLGHFGPSHLDKGKPPVFDRNEIYKTAWGLIVLSHDPIAFEAKQKARKCFGEEPGAIRPDPPARHKDDTPEADFSDWAPGA